MARRRDALALAEATKWKAMFWGQEECWRTERIAAMEPRMYALSRVIATWTASSEQKMCSSSPSSNSNSMLLMEGQSGEL